MSGPEPGPTAESPLDLQPPRRRGKVGVRPMAGPEDLEKLGAHPRLPEVAQVAGDARRRIARLAVEEGGDLVRHVDHLVRRHRAPSAHDPVGMGEEIEAAAARQGRPASCPRPRPAARAWAVGAETAISTGAPASAHLLHHLDRDAAGQHDGARAAASTPCARHRADQLVQRVVPADILAGQRRCPRPGDQKPGRMDRPRLVVQRLPVAQRVGRRRDLGGASAQAAGRDRRQRAHGLGEAVDAAEAAAHRARHEAPPRAASASARSSAQPHLRLDALRLGQHLEALDLVRAARRSPRSGEKPTAKSSRSAGVAIITACVRAVVDHRDRHLLGQRRGVTARAAPPRDDEPRRRCARRRGHASLRRRQDAARQRRPAPRSPAATSVGPFDGLTCTAVTLYSGQLVAQSEKSVVMTLAWVSGWWKVV